MNRAVAPRVAAVLLAAVLAATGCAADDPPVTGPVPDGTPGAVTVEASVVGVVAGGCRPDDRFGTGVVVADGLVATSAHTVAGAATLRVVDTTGDHDAAIVAFDKDHDLAVLRTDTVVPPAPLGDAVDGEPVTVLTWRPDDGVRTEPAVITRLLQVTIEDIYLEGRVTRAAFEFAAPVSHGDSGGPVVNGRGEIVGVIYAASSERPDVGFAVRSVEIRRLLDRVGEPVDDTSRCA